MQRTDFSTRLLRVVEERVERKRRRENRGWRRLGQAAMAIASAVACFFLLKAGTLAYFGDAPFAPVAVDRQTTGLSIWLTGIDPITQILAQAMAPGVNTAADSP